LTKKDEDGVRGTGVQPSAPAPKGVAMIKISRTKPIYLKLHPNYCADSYYSDGSKIINIMSREGVEVARIIIRKGKIYKLINYKDENWGEVIESR